MSKHDYISADFVRTHVRNALFANANNDPHSVQTELDKIITALDQHEQAADEPRTRPDDGAARIDQHG